MIEKTRIGSILYPLQQRSQHKQVRVYFCCLAILLGFPLLAGCASSSMVARSAVASTPSSGQQIIAKARAAHLLDATFTISWITHSTVTGLGTIPPIIGSGSGKVTMHPQRDYVSLHLAADTTTKDSEVIDDYGTQTAYLKDILMFGDNRWYTARENGPIFDHSKAALAYLHLTNATLVGAEQINRIAVWHVRGTLTDHGQTGVIDVYLRQDTYLPVKMLMHVTTPDTVEDDIYLYTSFNTGLTIPLPPASEIVSN